MIVCQTCSMSIETTGYVGQDEDAILEKHHKSGNCDPTKKRKPICPVKGARRFYQYPTPAHVKLATWRYASNTVFLLIILVAEEFQLLHLQLLMVGWRIFLAAFVSRTEQQKRPRASAAPSVKVLWIYCFYVMIFKWLDGNVIIFFLECSKLHHKLQYWDLFY